MVKKAGYEPRVEAREYWEGLKESKLRIQQCQSCERYVFYPREFCPHDFGKLEYTEVSGRAKVLAHTIVEKTAHPAYAAHTPFVMAVVQLEEGPTMMTHILDIAPEEVRTNLEVEITFNHSYDLEDPLPMFRPVNR
ncbi:Zn-ribbon domain-containing OB-fold protein [Bacillus dakarensis]|uniref:Zn-ribbon domain-containing OB-fold protein n=1 Tax=Robertmurraya dakarensis TaxID=1926278 RepID=UPI000980B1A6|nr:OB-fold domain-containing protein [Bacillus dakarensis]